MLLSLIVPAYNEASTIERLLEIVFDVPIDKEIVVINDCSRDTTKSILENLEKTFEKNKHPFVKNFLVIHKQKNEGKGAAIRTGIQHVTGDIVTIQDADLELNPHEYPKLLEPFETQNADIVFGSRFQMAGERRVFASHTYIPNRMLTLFSNLVSGLHITDMETCYKVFRRELLQSFKLEADRFGIEPELTAYAAKAVKNGRAMFEVPISYSPRTRHEGKKIGIKDGFSAIGAIIKYNWLK